MTTSLLTYLIYLSYGLVFFVMGVAIHSKDTSISRLEIARPLSFLAIFAYVHAFNEWLEFYLVLHGSTRALELPASYANLGSLALSFGCLLAFGASLLRIVFPQGTLWIRATTALFLAGWLWSVGRRAGSPDFFAAADLLTRHLLAFPGGIASGVGLIAYSRRLRKVSAKGAFSFQGAGLALATYAVLTGLVPSRTEVPVLAVQVEVLRSLSTFAVLCFMMNALRVFDVERMTLIEERLNRFAQSEKMHSLGKLAAGVAHEINTPLANASMNVEMLKLAARATDVSGEWEKRLEAIERNVDRASKIAQELLFFSRNKDSEFIATNVNEVIESTVSLLGAKKKPYDIQLRLEDVPPVRAIPWKLEEVFLNVLMNAMEAMPEGGAIEIRTKEAGTGVVAEVTDGGIGIAAENLGHVFDPFFTTKEPGQGTGLGLSICFGIVERHGGLIELESEVGRGTSVRITLPGGSP